ncbi:uncharacterized protein LOC112190776 [Rosa chinensis]|uniref:uncharacterized protein LOC112190776 n=1 Tax=Rosa chinensis TaxID=74649 RepID=UPI001AD8A763|nr:uncharacterized protein LOC112190776 [Rosa chinensis]
MDSPLSVFYFFIVSRSRSYSLSISFPFASFFLCSHPKLQASSLPGADPATGQVGLKPHREKGNTLFLSQALFLHFFSSSPSPSSSLQFFRFSAACGSALDQCSKLMGYSLQSLHRKRVERDINC